MSVGFILFYLLVCLPLAVICLIIMAAL
jgi:hypothetical protein